jgi:sn-glycerol 3-phosphate transport system ATP-binding protein
MAEVKLRGIRKSYGPAEVIHGVDCDIADGEFMVIVGPSGCGKSTLLRMIAGLERITDGTLAIGERVVNDLEPAERDIAMVFQNYALYPHMTVYANMAYGLKIRRLPKTEIDDRVKKAADILELGELLTRRPRQLSGGQRQRVAMGRAIVREPSVFLFDEPLSNLDAKLRVQMRIEIKKLQASLGITSVYVTHDQVEAMTLGHRLLVLNAGNVEQLGTPIELYEHPATRFVAGFIGSPSMNFLTGTLGGGGSSLHLPGGESLDLGALGPAGDDGRAVSLGIRPEHLELATDGDVMAELEVDLVEQLGADTLVHGHFGNDRSDLTLRLAGVCRLGAGERLPLRVSADHLHLFDETSGRRLG